MESKETKESKVNIKVDESTDNIDFTFIVPKDCSFEQAKKASMILFEHLVRVEWDAIRAQKEKDVAAASAEPVAVDAELVDKKDE